MRDAAHERLERRLGIGESVFLGLGSIVGTGVFVSIGLAAGVAGPAVILSLVLAALVATANGMSSASLAANYPVSGGTYEYAHRTVHPVAGFVAGWVFLAAKSASAATAALGFAGYTLYALGSGSAAGWLQPLALAGVAILVLVAARGITGSATFTIVVVSITLGALLLFVAGGLASLDEAAAGRLWPLWRPSPGADGSPLAGMLHGAALMFVAYTGYGRIATLGEEVREPRRTIPRAIVVTLAITMLLYVSVGAVGVATAGPEGLLAAAEEQAAPLVVVARTFRWPLVAPALALGAVTAMLGVLLNLVLGLSRVLLAMGRRGDMPPAVARVRGATPRTAVFAVGAAILGLVLIGDVRVTWSFSAFTVLIYYALTNLAALRLPPERRLFPQIIPALGLAGCLGLAFWVERGIWLAGLGVIALGLLWRVAARRLWGERAPAEADPV